MAEDPIKQSRRAIDLYTADQFGRIDEKLRTVRQDVDELKEEVKGAHGRPGLGEQVRSIVKVYGFIIGGITMVVSWFPWIYDHFLAKTLNQPVFGEGIREKWLKQSTKRIRIYNRDEGKWEYFYAVEEVKDK